MRRIWALADKDLLQTRRDKLAGLFIVIMPIAFTLFLGLIIGTGEQAYPLVLADQDKGDAARELVRGLRRSEVVSVEAVGVKEVDKQVDNGQAAAGLIIPKGYSEAVAAGRPAELTVVRDAGSSGAQTAEQEVRTLAAQQAVQTRAATAATEAVAQAYGIENADRLRRDATQAVAQSLSAPVVTVRTVQSGSSGGEVPSGFDLTSTGMIINFVLFSTMTAGVALIMERRSGTLQRLLTTRATRGELIGGKVLGMFVLTFIQQILLIGIGALAFGVDYFNDPAALLLVMISLSALVSCLGLLLATLFGSEQALIAATVLISMAWAAMSGGWFPLEITGPTFSAIGHVWPTAWILDAMRGIILKDYGVADVLPAVGYAFAWAAGFFLIGVWRFRSTEK
jgi:ABC-2 type transport system permease protein